MNGVPNVTRRRSHSDRNEIVAASPESTDGSAFLAALIEELAHRRDDGYGFGIHFASRLIRTISQAEPGTVKPEWQSVHTLTFWLFLA